MSRTSAEGASFLDKARSLVPTERVYLDELKMNVVVRGLTQGEINRATRASMLPVRKKGAEPDLDTEKLTALLLAASLYDEDGVRLIPEGSEDALNDIPSSLWNRLNTLVTRINGIGGTPEKN